MGIYICSSCCLPVYFDLSSFLSTSPSGPDLSREKIRPEIFYILTVKSGYFWIPDSGDWSSERPRHIFL